MISFVSVTKATPCLLNRRPALFLTTKFVVNFPSVFKVCPFAVQRIVDALVRGGWPIAIHVDREMRVTSAPVSNRN